jgi:hypothetical protein
MLVSGGDEQPTLVTARREDGLRLEGFDRLDEYRVELPSAYGMTDHLTCA